MHWTGKAINDNDDDNNNNMDIKQSPPFPFYSNHKSRVSKPHSYQPYFDWGEYIYIYIYIYITRRKKNAPDIAHALNRFVEGEFKTG